MHVPATPTARTPRAQRSRSTKRARRRASAAPATGADPARPEAGSGLAPGMQAVNTVSGGRQRRGNDGVPGAGLRLRARRRAARRRRPAPLRRDAARRAPSSCWFARATKTPRRRRGRALHLRGRRGSRADRRRATQAPASSEAEDKPWGDRVAVVTDPDGYRWVLATFKKLAPFAIEDQ